MKNHTQHSSTESVRVWDIGVRLFHWSLVATVIATYFLIDPRPVHRTLGYIVIGLIGFRLIWGFVGTRHARFLNFLPGPKRLITYLQDMLRGREARYLGHNPAGSVMIILLLATLCAVGISGYMMGMDAYFGQSWVEHAHELLVNILIALVACHVSGVIYSSWRHRENLVKSMITGQKDLNEPEPHH